MADAPASPKPPAPTLDGRTWARNAYDAFDTRPEIVIAALTVQSKGVDGDYTRAEVRKAITSYLALPVK